MSWKITVSPFEIAIVARTATPYENDMASGGELHMYTLLFSGEIDSSTYRQV